MKYLVNVSKRRIKSLHEDILKITILTTNTLYPSRKIRRIRACTHQRPQSKQAQYAISREDRYTVVHDKEFNEQTIHTVQGSRMRILIILRFSHEDVNEHIEKVLEIVDLYHIPNITIDQVMLKAFPMFLTGAASRASVSVMPLSTYLNLGLGELTYTKLIVELADRTVKYPKGIIENVIVGIGKFVFLIDFIFLDMPDDINVPLILRRPFFSSTHAKIDVSKIKITLRVGEERIIFTSVKPASSLIKRVNMLSLRERMELDLEARLMGETLVLNRSLDHFFEDYIELNDLNEPSELRRDQVDELIPTIKQGEVVEKFKARNDARIDCNVFRYPSD
nr:hypothetical protein [Tanacetum cinerariifolium]